MQRYFHATKISNIFSIRKQGLKPIWDYIYLTDTLDSACKWMGPAFSALGEAGFAVVEVEMESDKLKNGIDHSPIMEKLFGVGKSLTYDKVIPPKKIIEIHFFSINKK